MLPKPMPELNLNNKPADEATEEFLSRFKYFTIWPTKIKDLGSGDTEVVICATPEAEAFTIYGLNEINEHEPIHDAPAILEAVRIGLLIQKYGEAFFSYEDMDYGTTLASKEFSDLAENICEMIYTFNEIDFDDDILSDPELREIAYEEHPWSRIQDAFILYSDHGGIGTCRDPNLPIPEPEEENKS